MKLLIALSTIIICKISLASTTIVSSIYKIDYPIQPGEKPLILLTNGLVIKSSLKRMPKGNFGIESSDNFIFEIDEKRNLMSLRPLHTAEKTTKTGKINSFVENFKPTIFTSPNEIQRIFKGFNKKSKIDSQCYNRSHIWAYESHKNFGISSMKIFLFFTRSYIRDYDYKWWFHNAPMTYLYVNNSNKEIVLDPEFSSAPLDLKKWTDIFIKDKSHCEEVKKYSDYNLNQESRYCFIIKESMYYYQPLDLEKLEESSTPKVDWIDWEIKNGFMQGFGLVQH